MRNVGGARRGLNFWLLQRASAVAMAIFLPLFLGLALSRSPLDYAAWRALFSHLAMKIGSLMFIAAVLAHAWIGLREILIDYVHPLAIRLPLYFLFATLYLVCLVWAADILWGLG
ncbi:MAG: succinate dehydrogenase, hydrophobic membrane anchor protein [Thiobacillaceae bacterium]|jgi:succinate dehydrogenase / fumarate reductase membrane anchor subunit|nr:succinate dehydrogenase, hydrophobic membrane anchor protein [Thiobacillaceae bacterium]